MSDSKWTLWKLLGKKQVVIPIIQRDYAQGRVGKGFLRKTFLNEIKNHLSKGTKLTLDFVYGNEEEGKFQPLDGQQRLTTLWLLHWYVAFRNGMLSDIAPILENFTYETRTSSKEFCLALCENMKEVSPEKVTDVSEYIKGQTWFYSAWLQDPTIGAMLTTIGGETETKDDSIEGVFSGVDYSAVWNRLTVQDVITFQLMIIGTEKLPISDDLYIKMNARGKQLTDFENFKADLMQYLREHLSEEQQVDYASKIDNAWTDVFWNNRGNTSKIEAIYFEFINRYIYNEVCIRRDKNRTFEVLGKERGADYEGFDIYVDYVDQKLLEHLDTLFSKVTPHVLKAVEDFFNQAAFYMEDDGTNGDEKASKYNFIPQYDEKEKDKSVLCRTTQKERIYFLAICRFLEGQMWDRQRFYEWLRVVRNLVENGEISNVDNMINCLLLVDKLSKNAGAILSYLAVQPEQSANTPLEKQYREECEKAKQILSDVSYEKQIIEMERHAFFNGSIRFLYKDENGCPDWSLFRRKAKSAEILFDDAEQVKFGTIKCFLNLFENFDEIQDQHLFTKIGAHGRHACWKKNILLNERLYDKVHQLLLLPVKRAVGAYKQFLDSDLVEYIVAMSDGYKYRYMMWNQAVYAKYTSNGVVVTNERFRIDSLLLKLHHAGTITLDDGCIVENKNFVWGLKVVFTYNERAYCYQEEQFYLYDRGTAKCLNQKVASKLLMDEMTLLHELSML